MNKTIGKEPAGKDTVFSHILQVVTAMQNNPRYQICKYLYNNNTEGVFGHCLTEGDLRQPYGNPEFRPTTIVSLIRYGFIEVKEEKDGCVYYGLSEYGKHFRIHA